MGHSPTRVTHRTRCHRKWWTFASGVQRRAWSWHHSDAQEGGRPACSALRRGWDWAGTRRGVPSPFLWMNRWGMCMASVRDCSALAAAHPVDDTKASIPWFMSSQAGKRKGRKKTAAQLGSEIRLSRCHRHYLQQLSTLTIIELMVHFINQWQLMQQMSGDPTENRWDNVSRFHRPNVILFSVLPYAC